MKSLEKQGKFNEREISYFSMYLENRYFLNPFRDCFVTLEDETKKLSQLCLGFFDKDQVKSQKEIFNYLSNHYREKNEVVTSEMIEQFDQKYQKYLIDKRADRRKKMSHFLHEILNFFKF